MILKFKRAIDVKKFLTEIEDFDKVYEVDALIEANLKKKEKGSLYEPTLEELKTFLKRRSPLVKTLKDRRRKAATKQSWRQNRVKLMKGIKAYHKSTVGKRFHRKLGRFLATRIFRAKNEEYEYLFAKNDMLKGIATARQAFLIELEYFHTMDEQAQLEEMVLDYVFPMFQTIENKLIKSNELDEDEVAFICDLTDTHEIIEALAKKNGKEFAETEKVWNSIASGLEKKDITVESENFYVEMFSQIESKLGKKTNAKRRTKR